MTSRSMRPTTTTSPNLYYHEAEDCRSIWARGEYLYTADGPGGFEVYDIAHIDDKEFSERIQTSPVSPLGQRTYVEDEVRHRRRRLLQHIAARSGAHPAS